MWKLQNHKSGWDSDFVFSTKPIIRMRVQDVNKSRYISHPAQYASLFSRVYSAWFMGWPVRHLFCMRGEIYCQNPRKNTRCFLNWVSPKHFSRLPLPKKQIEVPGPHLVQWSPLGFKFGNHIDVSGLTCPPFCVWALKHFFRLGP